MPVSRRGLPLLLTIAVHLLLACLFLARRDYVPSAPSGPQRFFVALIAQPAQPPRRPSIALSAIRSPAPAVAPARAAAPHDAAAVTLVPITEVAPTPPAISAGELLERARRDVGKVDRELRGDTPPVPLVRPDTAQARFERAMAGAWKDRSQTMVVDRYMSADGVVIERVSRGGDAKCYMSGTVNFVPGILHDSSRAQTVSCPPAGSGWTRK